MISSEKIGSIIGIPGFVVMAFFVMTSNMLGALITFFGGIIVVLGIDLLQVKKEIKEYEEKFNSVQALRERIKFLEK